MAQLKVANPLDIELDPARIQLAYDLLRKWTTGPDAPIPGAGLLVGRHGKILPTKLFGKQGPEADAEPIGADAMFLLASITKPVTYLGALRLVEQGLLNLTDPVTAYIPEFAAHHKDETLVLHLFTHTSGLPDMPPDNEELRKRHAPLKDFIDRAINAVPLFPPGTRVSYQSMGTLIVAEIIQRISGIPIRDFLKQEILTPLGLVSCALGSRGFPRSRLVRVRVPEYQLNGDYGWNSSYWQEFGAPWGGMFSTLEDFGVICQMLLNGGAYPGGRLFAPGTVKMMSTNRLDDLPDLPEPMRRGSPWGLGWRLNHRGGTGSWGDILGPNVFGHSGSTGTLAWIDPDKQGFCLLFTSGIYENNRARLVHISNAVAAAFV